MLAWFVLTFIYQYVAALGSFKAVINSFSNDRILTALLISIASSIVTTLIAIPFGVSLAYVFAIKEFKLKGLMETLAVDIPQTFPPVAEGMIFFFMLGPASLLHINLAYTFTALVIAKLFVAAPFLIAYTTRKFREIKQTGMDLTAQSLGANPFQVFTTIYLPLARNDIAAGSAMCWARAMGELGGSLIFAGVIPGITETLPTFIATQATSLTVEALGATILATTASALALVYFKRLTLKR